MSQSGEVVERFAAKANIRCMMATSSERIIIQSDWDEVLKDSEGKIWISYKASVGHRSIHGELISNGLADDEIPYVIAPEGFCVDNVTQKSMEITFRDQNYRCKCMAPSSDFQNIHLKSVVSLDVTPGGLGVSVCAENKMKIWETKTGVIRRTLDGHIGDIYSCKYFPSGLVILSSGADMILRIWSAETGICPAKLKGHKGGISDTAIVDRGRNVVSCSRDGSAKLWDCGHSMCITTLATYNTFINGCAVASVDNSLNLGHPESQPSDREIATEGKLLLLGCEDSFLHAVALHSREEIFDIKCSNAVNCCCFLTDIHCLCGTQNGEIYYFDIRNTRTPINLWKESRSAVLCLLPKKDGFFAGTGDGSCFWRSIKDKPVIELTGANCDPIYKVAEDGKYVYTACRDGHIRKYHIPSELCT